MSIVSVRLLALAMALSAPWINVYAADATSKAVPRPAEQSERTEPAGSAVSRASLEEKAETTAKAPKKAADNNNAQRKRQREAEAMRRHAEEETRRKEMEEQHRALDEMKQMRRQDGSIMRENPMRPPSVPAAVPAPPAIESRSTRISTEGKESND